ncbi:MAG: hypothetical protein ACKN81_02185 [Pirellulaceae bacterium]
MSPTVRQATLVGPLPFLFCSEWNDFNKADDWEALLASGTDRLPIGWHATKRQRGVLIGAESSPHAIKNPSRKDWG